MTLWEITNAVMKAKFKLLSSIRAWPVAPESYSPLCRIAVNVVTTYGSSVYVDSKVSYLDKIDKTSVSFTVISTYNDATKFSITSIVKWM